MPEVRQDILDFLKTDEGKSLSDAEVGERMGANRGTVWRLRKRLAGGSASPAPLNGVGTPALPAGSETLALTGMELDAGTRVRVLSEPDVARYVRDMEQAGGILGWPALEVWEVGLPRPVLVKGFHRFTASERVFGADFSWTVVRKQGTLAAAILEAMRDNREHGVPLSGPDRVGILRRIFDDYGPKKSAAWIRKEVGENDHDLIERVRAEWLRDHGQGDPGVREVERGGSTYEQKVPRRKKGADRGPDASQPDAMDVENEGADEAEAEKARRIDEQYLLAIPARQHVHPDALAAFDAEALGFRDAKPALNSLRRWCEHHFPEDGRTPGPLYAALEKVATMPEPVPVGDARGWVACRTCPDKKGLSTGKVDGKPCKSCKGTCLKIPGF